MVYYYYFQDKNKKTISEYLISINPINCDLQASKEGEQESNEHINQFIIKSNEKMKLYYKNNLVNDICEFTISAIEYVRKTFKELIICDGIYQNYQIVKEMKYNSTKFNYLFFKEDIRNENIIININKKSDINLILEYAINNNKIINKTISKYNEIIQINVKDINYNNSSFQELNDIIVLKIIISIQKRSPYDNFDFKIKINGKNVPSYLNSEEIEYGLIHKGQYIYYYFDYIKNDKFQIFFDCKGYATFKVTSNIDKTKKEPKKPNYLYYNNKYNLLQENDLINEPNNNYFNIEGCSHDICQAYITIYISQDNEKYEKALFNIYRHSEKKEMSVPLNHTIYGVLVNNIPHRYYTDINFDINSRNPIKIVLNCKKCKMCYYTKEPRDQRERDKCQNPFEPSKDKYLLIQNHIKENINKINYVVFTDNQNKNEIIYYSIYIYRKEIPKYINQNIPEICETPCQLILPIYQFYYFNQKNIILYVPDDEQVIIYEKIIKMNEVNKLENFDLRYNNDNSSRLSLISNKLIIDIDEIKKFNDDLYMQIQIKTKNEDKNITFITSQFYNSLNTEKIPYSQNIYTINNNESTLGDILNYLHNNKLYKIDISLIEGSGLFIVNNNNQNINYSLSYDTQERVTFILEYNNSIFKPKKNIQEKNFIFYMNIEEKDNRTSEDELIFRKTNYFNYFKDNKQSNIFPINLKLQLNNDNKKDDLHINLRFSKLIRQNNINQALINVTNEIFDIKVYVIKIKEGKNERKELEGITKYYCDLRRGYIYIEKSNLTNQNYIEIVIEKNIMNKNNYERVSLDITPFDLESNIEIPRNNYLEIKIKRKKQEIKLAKPKKEYKNTYIELSSNNKFEFSLGNISYNKSENINGNNYYSIINNEETEYILSISSSSNNTNNKDNIGTILLKYCTKKDQINQFKLINNDIFLEKIGNDNDNNNNNYNFKLNHSNIINENKLNYNYNLSYLIRLYNSFSFEGNNEPKNILVEEEPVFCFRKELNELELKKDSIEYEINFGKLIKSKYYISILGEIVNDSNIEYFAYNYIDFIAKGIKNEIKFDYTWIIIILILLSMLIFVIYFLIKVCINMKNNKNYENDERRKALII